MYFLWTELSKSIFAAELKKHHEQDEQYHS